MFKMISAQQFVISLMEAVAMGNLVNKSPNRAGPGRRSSIRQRTGETYPHTNKRQNARYARQLAAKQINFITHGPRAA